MGFLNEEPKRMPASQKRNVRCDRKTHVNRDRRRYSFRNCGTARSCPSCNYMEDPVASRVYDEPCRRELANSRSYRRIKWGLRKSNPAAIVLWVFHKIPSSNGLTARRIISFLKTRYVVVNNPVKVGKCIGSMLRCAVEFGLLQKLGDKYFLKRKVQSRT